MGSTRSSAGVRVDGSGKGLGRPVDPPADLGQLLREHAEVGPPLEDPLGLRDGAPCTRRIGDGQIGPGDLQQGHDDGRWQRVRHQRPYQLRVDQLLAPARQVAVVDGDAGGYRVHQHRGGRRTEVHPLDPAMTVARMLRGPLPVATTHRDARPQREREERVAAAGRRRIHGLRERRVRGGRIAEHHVRLRQRLERQRPPRAAARLRGDGCGGVPVRVDRPATDHDRPQHRPERLEGRRPVRGNPVEGRPLDDVGHALGLVRSSAQGIHHGRAHRECRAAREGLVVERLEPPGEPVAVTEQVGPKRRTFDQDRCGVGVAACDRVFDGELRAAGIQVPDRGPVVEFGQGSRLTALQVRLEVVAQQVVVAEGGRLARELTDEQVRVGEPPQPVRRIGQGRDGLGKPRLEDIDDRRPREQRDVEIVEYRAELRPEVLRDVAVPTRHLACADDVRRVTLVGKRRQVDRRRPPLRPLGERSCLVAAQPESGRGCEGFRLLGVERQFVLPDLEQRPVRT